MPKKRRKMRILLMMRMKKLTKSNKIMNSTIRLWLRTLTLRGQSRFSKDLKLSSLNSI